MIDSFPPVATSDPTAAFNSGLSASNAITVTDELDINGNPTAEVEEIDLDKLLDVNSAIAVEKEIAADTIGTLFNATQAHFLPYVEQCTLELVKLLSHYYEGIRKSALDSLLEIVRTFYDLSDHQEWEAGANVVRIILQSIALVSHNLYSRLFLLHRLSRISLDMFSRR